MVILIQWNAVFLIINYFCIYITNPLLHYKSTLSLFYLALNDMKTRKQQYFIVICLAVLSFLSVNIKAQNGKPKELSYYLSNLPFAKPEISIPVFPDRVFSIMDFGAVGNGRTLNTEAFAKAIDTCAKLGGGKVIVPRGIWLTGPIKFQSNINLHLEKGALVLFSSNHSLYPIFRSANSKNFMVCPPVYGYNLENIAITGEGIMDGAGETWRQVKKSKTTEAQWNELVSSGGVISSDGNMYWPSKEAMEGSEYLKKLTASNKTLTEKDFEPARDFLRPNLVLFQYCKNINTIIYFY